RLIKAVVFDLDGTLIHSAPDIAASLNILLAECDLRPFAQTDTYRFIGAGAQRLVTDAFAALGQTLTETEIATLTARYLGVYAQRGSPDTVLFPGVVEFVQGLRQDGIRLGICTNKAETISRDVIAQFGLSEIFTALIGGDSGFGRKPEPGPLLEVCRRLDVP